MCGVRERSALRVLEGLNLVDRYRVVGREWNGGKGEGCDGIYGFGLGDSMAEGKRIG